MSAAELVVVHPVVRITGVVHAVQAPVGKDDGMLQHIRGPVVHEPAESAAAKAASACYPCIHALPLICRNPARPSVTG